jgi:ketosteroid isomerase-like protein
MSAEEQLKDAYRRIIDAMSRGDADSLDDLVASDVVDHNPIPNQAPGLDGSSNGCRLPGPRSPICRERWKT